MALLHQRLGEQLFAHAFPKRCPDNEAVCGTNETAFWRSLKAWVPDLPDRLQDEDPPDVVVAMDLIEFMYDNVAEYMQGDYHSFFDHHHLIDFNSANGRRDLRVEANRLLKRNRMAYELDPDGRVRRPGPPILRASLEAAVFDTGDQDLDELFNRAREKFRSPDAAVRRESLEQLWDAFERLKSLALPGNKKQSVEALIAGTGLHAQFQELLDTELAELTRLGNAYRIRHSETDRLPIESSAQVDYLFARLFAVLLLLLRTPEPELEA